MEWMNYTLSILAGLAATIPLVNKLVEYVQKAIRERNWGKVLDLVINYMEIAETKFATGGERKAFVLEMVAVSADMVDYDIDISVVSKLIDDLCSMSKVVNSPVEKSGEQQAC